MGRGTVWLTEEDDEDGFLTGTFSGFHDTDRERGDECWDLTFDEALEWARARADRVCVELGDYRRFSAGAKPLPDYPPWPPDDLPRPVRRRRPGEEWKDRTDADPPIGWAVTAWLESADGTIREDDALIRTLAERAEAISWDRDELDGSLADMERAVEGARGGAEVGWFSYHMPAYRLRFDVSASTAPQAQALVSGRLDPPAEWVARVDVVPAAPHEGARP